MAKRLIRDITDSRTINSLDNFTEVVFLRLLMKADDFGKFYGDHDVLKSFLFPMKKEVTEEMITTAVATLKEKKIIIHFPYRSSMFIMIPNFGQRLRSMRSKFPDPPPEYLQQFLSSENADIHTPSDNLIKSADKCPPEVEVEDEDELEVEVEEEGSDVVVDRKNRNEGASGGTGSTKSVPAHETTFEIFWNAYDKKVGREKALKKWRELNVTSDLLQKIMKHVEEYKAAQPDKQFRKDPTTYINNKSWNDEIISRNSGASVTTGSKVRTVSAASWSNFAAGS